MINSVDSIKAGVLYWNKLLVVFFQWLILFRSRWWPNSV